MWSVVLNEQLPMDVHYFAFSFATQWRNNVIYLELIMNPNSIPYGKYSANDLWVSFNQERVNVILAHVYFHLCDHISHFTLILFAIIHNASRKSFFHCEGGEGGINRFYQNKGGLHRETVSYFI